MANLYDVTFAGNVLSLYFDVSWEIERRLPTWEPALITVPSSDVAIFGGTQALPLEISMTLITIDGYDRDSRQILIRELSRILAVDQPRMLKLDDEHGLYRMALPQGEIEVEPLLNADVVRVTFVCPDPRLFGSTYTRSIGTSAVSVSIGGSAYPTEVVVTATATPNSSGTWRLTDSTTGEYLEITGMQTGRSHSVSIDCSARSVSVDGVVTMLTPESDWLTLKPGTHSMRVTTGSGTATLSFREMWW